MALPDYYMAAPGSQTTWKASGGTRVMTLTGLANGSARQGVYIDFGSNWARRQKMTLRFKLAVAGTNGNAVELYMAESPDGTNFDGGATGTDAALSNSSEVKHQMTAVGEVPVSNALATGFQQKSWEYNPRSRYAAPAVINGSGQAFSATASDHTLTIEPINEGIIESAP